jgi:hypothetical protein
MEDRGFATPRQQLEGPISFRPPAQGRVSGRPKRWDLQLNPHNIQQTSGFSNRPKSQQTKAVNGSRSLWRCLKESCTLLPHRRWSVVWSRGGPPRPFSVGGHAAMHLRWCSPGFKHGRDTSCWHRRLPAAIEMKHVVDKIRRGGFQYTMGEPSRRQATAI